MNLVKKKKQLTVVLDFQEASQDPAMKTAMEYEINSFKAVDCVEEVDMSSLSDFASKNRTRWVLTLQTDERKNR